ncbi:hypothetical protein A2U01_0004284 [Trifolium medium]|uniref:RVP_2 domain-containing protein n=1 Tax=Trifolium medium TaxID=97028 RepID=A0A392M7L1_9FABA|nr:hypothetical protein [Trifolium medium]
MQERRAQGLCYYCDEKFIAGHKCTAGKYLLLLVEDDSNTPEIETELEVEENANVDNHDETYFQLSPQALTGHFSPQTLKFQGHIEGPPVMVLVDTGSTHNILQPRIANHLQLATTPIPQFSVMVGSGSHLHCQGICHDVPITLQDKLFCLPFYLLPIEGADVVLGMEWLRTLGPINADFSIPSITFSHKDTPITLKGEPKACPTLTTYNQLCQLIHTNSIASFHLLTFQNPTIPEPQEIAKNTFDPNLPPEISSILQSYPTVF